MPINSKETVNNILSYITNSKIWNSIITNPFMLAIIVTLCTVLLFITVYNEDNTITKNIFTS